MSQTYIAIIINILGFFLPKIGVNAGSAELTTIIQSIVIAGSGIWVLYRRYRAGGVSVAGIRI